MKYIKKIVNHPIFKFFFGFSVIILFLIFRFKEKIEHPIIFAFSYKYLFFIVILIIFYCCSFYKTCFSVFEKTNRITKYFYNYKNYVYDCLNKTYQMSYKYNFKIIDYLVQKIVIKFLAKEIKFKKTIYFFGFIFPRLLISLTLFLDLVYFNYMYYLYKIILLIWIPILFRIILYILNDWAEKIYVIITKQFKITIFVKKIDNKYQIQHGKKECLVPKKELLYEETAYNSLITFWLRIIIFNEIIETESKKLWVQIFYLIIYFIFIFSWVYVIYKSIKY